MRTWLTTCLLAPLTASPVLADPIDCDALLHTKVPFEITMKDGKGNQFLAQIYRSDDHYRTVYNKTSSGIATAIAQNIFTKLAVFPDQPALSLSYDVPTNQNVFDRGSLDYHVTLQTAGSDKTTKTTAHVHVIGDEKVTFGPCAFTAHHFTIDEVPEAPDQGPRHQEVWSVEGLTSFRTVFKTTRNGRSSEVVREVTGVRTDFIPWK